VQSPRPDITDRSFRFARGVVIYCRRLDRTPGVNRTLATQLLRSGTSIGANIKEAQAGQSRADFVHKASVACKEARETHYWLRLIESTDPKPTQELQDLLDEARQLALILTAIVRNTKANTARHAA